MTETLFAIHDTMPMCKKHRLYHGNDSICDYCLYERVTLAQDALSEAK